MKRHNYLHNRPKKLGSMSEDMLYNSKVQISMVNKDFGMFHFYKLLIERAHKGMYMMDYSNGYHRKVYRKEPLKHIKRFEVRSELKHAMHSRSKHEHKGPSYKEVK